MFWEILAYDLRPEILLRLGLSLVAGLVIGIERESHGRAAGLRTTLIVCLSSTVAMIVSDSFYRESFANGKSANWHPDPARLAAGILAGMGFLGAGVIVHERDHIVRGVTTAATLWFSAIIGLSLGAGSIGIGIASTLLSIVILSLIPRFENRMNNDWYSDLSIHLDGDGTSVDSVSQIIEEHHIKIKGLDWQESFEDRSRVVLFHIKYRKGERLTLPGKLVESLKQLPDVRRVHWHG